MLFWGDFACRMARSGPLWAALLLCPAIASADEINGVRSLSIDVEGRIAQHCSMGSIPNLNLGNLETAARLRQTRVLLDCNVPISIQVKAINGALANTRYPAGQGPYSGKLDYDIGLTVPVRTPERSVVTRNFRSTDLIGGQSFSSNGGIAIDDMDVSIELAAVSHGDGALLGGDYSETIEITIAPS
jgi:hypothetical protein